MSVQVSIARSVMQMNSTVAQASATRRSPSHGDGVSIGRSRPKTTRYETRPERTACGLDR